MYKKKDFPREYRIWKAMRARCNAPCYSNNIYQKKGIKVCERWNSFHLFITDMGPSNGLSIERKNNDGNYELSNCKWADSTEQSNNRGDFNKIFTHNNKTLTLKQWSKELNIKYTTLYQRVYRSKLSFEEAIELKTTNRLKLITYNGKTKSLKEWCTELNIPYQKTGDRLRRGWSVEKAFN